MAVMGKKTWAVMCGAIRQEFELYTTIAMLCDYRSRGLIDGIVISTWKGEVENIPNLREKLKKLNIYITEIDSLDDDMGKFMDIGYARQAYQFKAGLDFVPDDVFVLRCRTDYSEDKIKKLEYILEGKVDLSIGNHGAWISGMHYRIAVLRFYVTRAFGLIDSGFLGYKDDLYKMIDFEMMIPHYGFNMKPDISFFLNIFLKRFPVFSEFVSITRNFAFSVHDYVCSGLKRYIENNQDDKNEIELPGVFNKFYALWFVVLDKCFYLCNGTTDEVKSLNIMDFLTSERVTNMESLRMVVQGECEYSKGYAKLYKEICSIAAPNYAERLHITESDYFETVEWVKNVLKLNPKKILKWKNGGEFKQVGCNDTNFEQALGILFDEYSALDDALKKRFSKVIYNICFDEKLEYYNAIVDNLAKLEGINEDVHDLALAAAARTVNPYVLKVCAKRLFLGQVAESKVGATKFIFERWGGNSEYFYKFPMMPDKIAAFYYYGRYAEARGDKVLAETFYKKLVGQFGLEKESDIDSYAETILSAIKQIVDMKYEQFEEDLSIKYMVDFLVDEQLEEYLSEKAVYSLRSYIMDRKYSLPFKQGADNAFENLLENAQKVSEASEADYVVKMIIREMSKKTIEERRRAEEVLRFIMNKCGLQDHWLMVVYFATDIEEITSLNLEKMSDRDYFLLMKVLADKKLLNTNVVRQEDLKSGDAFRSFLYSAFKKVESEPRISFSSIKNGTEIWLNDKKFMEKEKNTSLSIIKYADGSQWPQGDSASSSSYAAFITYKNGYVIMSIALGATNGFERKRLLSNMSKEKYSDVDCSARVVKFKKVKCAVNSTATMDVAIEKAIKEFLELGDELARLI